jgi:hypothetical protein
VSIDKLKEDIEKYLEIYVCENLVLSMTNRLKKVIENSGGYTKY